VLESGMQYKINERASQAKKHSQET
jgi:hypothetical protein